MTDLAGILASTPWLLAACVFLVSLLVGSFLNVVIHRVPIMLEREWKAQAREMLADSSPGAGPPAQLTQVEQPSSVESSDSAIAAVSVSIEATVELRNDELGNASIDALSATPVAMEQVEERYNLLVPRSRCPSCNAEITALQNIPVISWLLLGGTLGAQAGSLLSARLSGRKLRRWFALVILASTGIIVARLGPLMLGD